MNPHWERLLDLMRRSVESNVKSALRSMEITRKQDLKALGKSLDQMRQKELAALKSKMDNMILRVGRMEAVQPYLESLESFARRAAGKPTKKKRAKRMDAVSKIFLHAEKVYAQGHTILGCAIIYRNVVIPYAVRLWVPKSFAKKTQKKSYEKQRLEYRKLTELAADVIGDFPLAKVTVLFDAYYLCPAVTRACLSKKYRYVGVAKKNRNFFADGRDREKRKLSSYGANVLKREGRLSKCRGKCYRLAMRVGRLSKLGRVKLVFSRRAKERSWICMATNETRWGALRVLSEYLNRWPIEVLFKESKQYLGLGDYQVLRYRGVERYLHLVLIAHLLLTHLGASPPGAQAEYDQTKPLDLPSVPQLQLILRNKLWDHTIDNMQNGKQNESVASLLGI